MQLLQDYGGNALIENYDEVTPIDLAGIDNIRTAKLFLMNYPEYKNYMKENAYIDTGYD